jgi:hypothetical protein
LSSLQVVCAICYALVEANAMHQNDSSYSASELAVSSVSGLVGPGDDYGTSDHGSGDRMPLCVIPPVLSQRINDLNSSHGNNLGTEYTRMPMPLSPAGAGAVNDGPAHRA